MALNALEDLGFYCVDNLPIALVKTVLGHLTERFEKVALGIDVRGGADDVGQLPDIITNGDVDHIIFLTADNPTLIRRYSETRRKHPLDTGDSGLTRALETEARLLDPVLAVATDLINTTGISVHQLRRAVFDALGASGLPLVLLIESFAYKHGVPADVDVIFDARCLPNPHWEPALRPFTGRDPQVRNYLGSHAIVEEFIDDIIGWLERWIPRYEADHRNYLTIGIGCTGGKHRSVYIAETIASRLAEQQRETLTFHRQLG